LKDARKDARYKNIEQVSNRKKLCALIAIDAR